MLSDEAAGWPRWNCSCERPVRMQDREFNDGKTYLRLMSPTHDCQHHPPCLGPGSLAGWFHGCQLLGVVALDPADATVGAVFYHDPFLSAS
jgi:hypothetical protein